MNLVARASTKLLPLQIFAQKRISSYSVNSCKKSRFGGDPGVLRVVKQTKGSLQCSTAEIPDYSRQGPCQTVKSMSSSTGVVSESKSVESFEGPAVAPDWLAQNLHTVKVLDASWYMPAEKRNPFREFQEERIPGAIFFDIDAVSDSDTDLPHMLPSEEQFSASATKLGLSASDSIVVYDKKGIFSAARAWWMFRAFGHKKIWVLEGGFPLYKALGFPLTLDGTDALTGGGQCSGVAYEAKLQPHLVWSIEKVLENLESKTFQVVDARSNGRFRGVDPEPRAGLPGGHIPESSNVPFNTVLREGKLLGTDKLKQVFENAAVNLDKPIVASCGTGVTACVVALALHKLGREDVAVYDGSWTEWGGRSDTPKAT